MACTSKKEWKMDEDQRQILDTLGGLADPASGKEISAAAGLDSKVVSNKIKTLKTKGFVDSPVRCKYAITDLGRKHGK